MEYVFKANLNSNDARVKELAKIFAERGYRVLDFKETTKLKAICFLEPRNNVDVKQWPALSAGSLIFGYVPNFQQVKNATYINLNDDSTFIKQNNELTALAFRKIVGQAKLKERKMLICGWGRLAAEIEKIFTNWELSVLNFNPEKIKDLENSYGGRAYFENAPFEKFPVIVNTIPKGLIKPSNWKKYNSKQVIYDLASAPFGFDWNGVDKEKFNYQILPALPAKFFPYEAAIAVTGAIDRYLGLIAKPAIVLCITGSACSYIKILPILTEMVKHFDIYPVISPNATLPNRFVGIESFKQQIQTLTGHNLITNIAGAETLSANQRLLCSVVFPATGNTIAKLTHGITDTCVTMAVKALLRNNKPCVIGLATNDALSANAKNIGELLNRKNYYFVPFGQDDCTHKPHSCVCDFKQVVTTIEHALRKEQIQPLLLK